MADLKRRPIAEQTVAANEQHYEVPTELYLLCLGKHLKYSACLYKDLSPRCGLDAAEAAMLTLYCERAQLADGQRILELGCGWGSLSLFMAARYPRATVTSVSNSRTQKDFIDARAAERGITLDEARASLNASNPQGRIVQPSEIAAMVDFFCSENAPGLTNADIQINAGADW